MATNDRAFHRFRKLLECSICLELYNEPKMLRCTHEYCKQCLEEILKFKTDGTATIKCPLRCELETVLNNRETVGNLAASYTTKNILDTLRTEDVPCDSTDDDNLPECKVKNDCRKPVTISCCDQMMCNYCYNDHSQKPPVDIFDTGEQLQHRRFSLIYRPRDHELGVLCQTHSSMCTHYCVDETFLCMYCLQREHKTHSKNDIQTEARLLQEAVKNEIASLEMAKDQRNMQVKSAVAKVEQAFESLRESRASTGKPLLPLEEARLLDEARKKGNDYIKENHKQSFKVYNHFFVNCLDYFHSLEFKSDLNLVMRKAEILKKIRDARAGKQHVTLKLSGFDSHRPLGQLEVDIKESMSSSMFEFIPPLPNEGEIVLDEASAIRSKLRGNDFFKEQKYQEAIECYTQAILLCPLTSKKEMSIFYQNRAAANVQLGQWAKVVDDCTVAVQLNASNYKAMLSRAKAHKALGNQRQAYQDFVHGIVLTKESGKEPNAELVKSRDDVLASLCNELAEEHFRKRTPAMISEYAFKTYIGGFNYGIFNIPLTSDRSDSNFARIMCLVREAKYEKAMKLCQKEISSRDKHRNRALLLRGISKALLYDIGGAIEDFHEVSELSPNQGNDMLRLDALLNMYWVSGNVESLEKASQIDRHNATVYTIKAAHLNTLGQYEEAKINLKIAMSLDPTFVRARIAYCSMFLERREFFQDEEVENAILQTIQGFPDCGILYFVFGNYLNLTGRLPQALMNFDKAIALDPHNGGPYAMKYGLLMPENPEEAEGILLRAVESNIVKSDTLYRLLGRHQITMRDDAEASIKFFEKALDFPCGKEELLETLTLLEQARVSVLISKELEKNVWVDPYLDEQIV